VTDPRSLTELLLSLPHFPNDDPRSADGSQGYEHRLEHYRTVARQTPMGGIEIGGHYGFGIITMLEAIPTITEVAFVDNESAIPGSNEKCAHNIAAYYDLTGRKPVSLTCLTHLSEWNERGHRGWPLVAFVDGEHSYAACLTDLGFCLALNPMLLMVDDFVAIGSVRDACLAFSAYTGLPLEQDVRDAGLAIFRP
jgi:hypothetical protein